MQLPGVEDPEYLRERIERRGLRVGTLRRAPEQPDRDLGRPPSCPGRSTASRFRGRTTCARAGAGWWTRCGATTRGCGPARSCCWRRARNPGLYASDLPDWGSALLVCLKLGERARVLVDAGPHAIALADEDRLGGLYFDGRVHPFETFLVFAELGTLPRLLLGATLGVEATTAAVVDAAGGLRQGAARRPGRAARGAGVRRRAVRIRRPARRVQDRRARAVRGGARGARQRRGPDRRAAPIRLRGGAAMNYERFASPAREFSRSRCGGGAATP